MFGCAESSLLHSGFSAVAGRGCSFMQALAAPCGVLSRSTGCAGVVAVHMGSVVFARVKYAVVALWHTGSPQTSG